jgi:hypothetical protein
MAEQSFHLYIPRHTMSYSPMQDACPHSIPISDSLLTGLVHPSQQLNDTPQGGIGKTKEKKIFSSTYVRTRVAVFEVRSILHYPKSEIICISIESIYRAC